MCKSVVPPHPQFLSILGFNQPLTEWCCSYEWKIHTCKWTCATQTQVVQGPTVYNTVLLTVVIVLYITFPSHDSIIFYWLSPHILIKTPVKYWNVWNHFWLLCLSAGKWGRRKQTSRRKSQVTEHYPEPLTTQWLQPSEERGVHHPCKRKTRAATYLCC